MGNSLSLYLINGIIRDNYAVMADKVYNDREF